MRTPAIRLKAPWAASFLVLVSLVSMPTFAAGHSPGKPQAPIQVKITAPKIVAAGTEAQIHVSFKPETDVTDLKLVAKLPKGVELKSGSLELTVAAAQAGSEHSLDFSVSAAGDGVYRIAVKARG